MQILGYNYKLLKVDEHRKIDAFGRLLHDVLEIQIASNLAQQQLVSTVLHEIIEALNYHLGLGLRHDAIMALESGLYQTLTTNGVDLEPLARELGENTS